MNSIPRILVGGIGNIFLGDDAFGVEVAQRLMRKNWPENVKIVDFGIRGIDLTYALLESWEAVILIDAAPRGGSPGTLYLIEPDAAEIAAASEPTAGDLLMDAHSMDPVKVLRLARSMGGNVQRMLLVACEPTAIAEEMEMEISPAVRSAIPEAVAMVESLITRISAQMPSVV